MSWSLSAVGKPAPVAAKLAKDFANITYLGKEEAELKDVAAELVAKTLAATTRKDVALQVDCSGSGSTHPADGNLQTVSVVIRQIYGFIE